MIIYTDGACSGNGSAAAVGGFGVVILDDDENYIASYRKDCKGTTNNREELKAILYAQLHYGKSESTPIVYSDSAYAVNTLTTWMWSWARNGWVKSDNRPPENLDIIKPFYEFWNKGYRVDLRKCAGHKGVIWNEVADRLAVGDIEKADKIINKMIKETTDECETV